MIATLDKADNISFKYADLKQDRSLIEKVCQFGPVKNKLQFWQEQKQKNIICAYEQKKPMGGSRSIYVGCEKIDETNLRVYFLHGGSDGRYRKITDILATSPFSSSPQRQTRPAGMFF